MPSQLSRVMLGCAGWSLSAKVAAAFPIDGSHLERYAAVFSAVEINSSFYRSHRPATYARWRDSVPEDFRFSVKIPRTITHERRLLEAEDLLEQFINEVNQLADKLGCLLLQLPPSLKFGADEAEAFFALLRRQTGVPVACEPRHVSWFSKAAADLMRRHAIGCVRADPAPAADVQPAGFAGTTYIRLHGSPVIYRSAYDDAFLDALAAEIAGRIAAVTDQTGQVWCIFDNTADGEAIPNALALMKRLRHLFDRKEFKDSSASL